MSYISYMSYMSYMAIIIVTIIIRIQVSIMIIIMISIKIIIMIIIMIFSSCRGSTVTGCSLTRSFKGSWLLGKAKLLFLTNLAELYNKGRDSEALKYKKRQHGSDSFDALS